MIKDERYISLIQGSFKAYCFHAHNQTFINNEDSTEKELQWVPSKFHKFLCDTVQDFVERPTDKAYEILIISTPPQHGKSKTITETFPSWYVMKNPEHKVIEISYGDDLAQRFGKNNLDKVRQFGPLFNVTLDPKKATAEEYHLKGHEGYMISRGFSSPLTGYSGHLILIDDPIKNREDADSETKRNKLWNEFNDSIVTRTQAGSKIILIQTRWHEDDLAGRIMERMPEITTVINLECECESENDPLGRKKGDALCPEIKKGKAWLRTFKAGYVADEGARAWNALFQGHPTAREGNVLKRDWWRYYKYSDFENGELKVKKIIISVDAAFKDQEKNDFVAIQVWGKIGSRCYLLDSINEHLSFIQTMRKIRVMTLKYEDYTSVFIEDKANGSAIIQTLRDEIMGIVAVEPGGSKEARVEAVAPQVEAGNCFLPEDKEFTWDFVNQCASFPNGKHDDMVDAFSQALLKLKKMNAVERFINHKIRSCWEDDDVKPKNTLGRGDVLNVF